MRENEGVAARILLDFDADSEKIRNELIGTPGEVGDKERGASHEPFFAAPSSEQGTEALIDYVKREHRMMIGAETAELIQHEITSSEGSTEVEASGRDLVSGLPRRLVLTAEGLRSALGGLGPA